MPGQLIISLDFELLWGVRDHADRASYGDNIIGAREAIPHILELFYSHGMRMMSRSLVVINPAEHCLCGNILFLATFLGA